ncbi:MAG: VOC family protein [Gammaproteobacteria bacterium]|nr:VOC family protein [Gammaproteobacteria bacterium]
MQAEVMLFVRDVPKSSAFLQQLLGAKSGHGGDEYEMIVDDAGTLLFQLHRVDGDEHGVELREDTPRGAGVLVYVRVDDVRAVFRRAQDMNADIVTQPEYNPLAYHTEFVVRDLDGYGLAIYTRGKH